MLLLINFKNIFISILLNVSNIELKENSNTDESENFNTDVQIYLTPKRKYKKFIIIKVNFNITKRDGEEYPYKKTIFISNLTTPDTTI